MIRKITLVAVVAMLAMGTSMALAGTASHATNDAMAQETTPETTPEETPGAAETANVTFQNQTSNGTAVVVEEVVVPEGGFVVIHAAESADGAEMETTPEETPADDEAETEVEAETTVAEAGQQYTAGEVLGNSTYLDAGTHENVTVMLNETLTESQVLIAMPHQDTNDNQLYEFPEADDPYTEDGEAVTDWAEVTVEEDGDETATEDEEDEDETTTEEM